MGARITEILTGILSCYVGYFVCYKEGWDFVRQQPVPKFSGLILVAFGMLLVVVGSYRLLKMYFKKNRE